MLADVIETRATKMTFKNVFHEYLRGKSAETEELKEFTQHYIAFLKTLSHLDLPDK